ncbi:hypothetical protein Q5P01_015015 [Channa striata]|uniref:Uncharacterized protein n=1 Tax=Channa striata TaxID=64152 RepID=A0AA88SLL9_CHASR|nr:hypothetical protein Q5P01_015015 [Channa striata]
MGTYTTTGGREVSRQAAGYPITLGLLLHPLPPTLPSRRIQDKRVGDSWDRSAALQSERAARPLRATSIHELKAEVNL